MAICRRHLCPSSFFVHRLVSGRRSCTGCKTSRQFPDLQRIIQPKTYMSLFNVLSDLVVNIYCFSFIKQALHSVNSILLKARIGETAEFAMKHTRDCMHTKHRTPHTQIQICLRFDRKLPVFDKLRSARNCCSVNSDSGNELKLQKEKAIGNWYS